MAAPLDIRGKTTGEVMALICNKDLSKIIDELNVGRVNHQLEPLNLSDQIFEEKFDIGKLLDAAKSLSPENIDDISNIITKIMGESNPMFNNVESTKFEMNRLLNLKQRSNYGEMEAFSRILNVSDIGRKIIRATTKFHEQDGALYSNFMLNSIFNLNDIQYNDSGHIIRYLISDISNPTHQYNITDPELFNGWVCIDDIGG